jgi:hypothetical protein
MTTTVTNSTLNKIKILNSSGLDSAKYTVWVSGYMQDDEKSTTFYILQSDGTFSKTTSAKSAPFNNVSSGLTVDVMDIVNSGNNRLVFTVTSAGSTPDAYPLNGYTAYPFPGVPGVSPAGPYDIFEFGPNAQYDVSAVDSFGVNLSFTVSGNKTSYGPLTTISREQIGSAFTAFTASDQNGAAFSQLLYSSPVKEGYPELIAGQFSAIVSPKDWLAIYPDAKGLNGYWDDTVTALFTVGNQLDFYLNGATVGNYSGTSNGNEYTLSGPGGTSITIPKSDFSGNQGFIQAVRPINKGESTPDYETFGQIEAALFEAFSRGVILDGVVAKGKTIAKDYSSDAWIKTSNWFTGHKNKYNQKANVYDAYAKFFHYSNKSGKVDGNTTIFSKNSSGDYAMVYGFSLDENPNVGKTAWPSSLNTPSKTLGNVGKNETVSITVGPWKTKS